MLDVPFQRDARVPADLLADQVPMHVVFEALVLEYRHAVVDDTSASLGSVLINQVVRRVECEQLLCLRLCRLQYPTDCIVTVCRGAVALIVDLQQVACLVVFLAPGDHIVAV